MFRLIRAAALVMVTLLALYSTVANATATRVFVSGTGSDSNPCTRALPCRSFATAMGQAGAGGEIVVLDSAGYGTVTISQSLTITNPGGVEAGISTTSAMPGITINATSGTTVVLRGLTIEGNGAGTDGILINTAFPVVGGFAKVEILDCVTKDFTNDGIDIAPSGSGTVEDVVIDNTRSLNNGTGIEIAAASSAIALATINSTVADANGIGIRLTDTGGHPALILDSHADFNNSLGIVVPNTGLATMKRTTVVGTENFGGAFDVVNAGTVDLFNSNTIGNLDNTASGVANTDGTNNIGSVSGNALTPQALQ